MNDYMYSEEETTRLAQEGRIPQGAWVWVWDLHDYQLYYLRKFEKYDPLVAYPWKAGDHVWRCARLVTQKCLHEFCGGQEQPSLLPEKLPEKPPRGEPVRVRDESGDWQYAFLVYPPPDDEIANFYRFSLGWGYISVFMADTHRWRRLTEEEKQRLGIS